MSYFRSEPDEEFSGWEVAFIMDVFASENDNAGKRIEMDLRAGLTSKIVVNFKGVR